MNEEIDISGMDKAAVLVALYNKAHVQGLGRFHARTGDMPLDEARTILRTDSYADYLHGRVIKVDLAKDVLSTRLYDRDNGLGAARQALVDAGLLRD